MNAIPSRTWQSEFGIDTVSSPNFFVNKTDIDLRDTAVPYAHTVRRAFDLLELDGVWCDQNTPLVYFKLVDQITTQEMLDLHRRFWNHGGAAILVVITSNEVQVYSALTQPATHEGATNQDSGLVLALNRASQALREFLPAVESGEFFRKHAKSFDTNQRVDQALLFNLQATRQQLAAIATEQATDEDLDAFLCRLVFTCYLFDREVIGGSYLEGLGLSALPHLRDILGLRPRAKAKEYLYRLFHKLAQDFNGDLFSDDLDAEADLLSEDHMKVVEDFFRATDVTTGQQAIWPYDFGVIPIETVSAIYERFLKPSDKRQGAFYTPRFLAELVLDIALSNQSSLLGLRFLDPACGSGIFLVGLFNRLAEEWTRKNPKARNDRRARELMQLMQDSISGIDLNPTACRITAFSLYLAYLDQLTPRDIQDLQSKGNALPRLVVRSNEGENLNSRGVIWCGDFFHENVNYPTNVDVVIGNPPWGGIVEKESEVDKWCKERQLAVPNKQIAAAFIWKSTQHVMENGRVCLILPQGILFNQKPTAIAFQKAFLSQHTLDCVLNLTDYQRFLFNEAEYPALVLSYRRQKPDKEYGIAYWVPKVDWKVKNADVITISEYDRSTLQLQLVLRDLEKEDAPQIWKRMTWATPRDRRLLDRLADEPRLRDHVRQVDDKTSKKPWLIAAGFEPLGPNDNPDQSQLLMLPSDRFIETTSPNLQLFLLEDDCSRLNTTHVRVRDRSNKTIEVFRAPHVLINKGFSKIAFADFAVSFKLALRGIVGPQSDRKLLMFLAAYLRSSLAKYFLFHTSSSWGVSKQVVTITDLMRLPFPWSDTIAESSRANQIVDEVSQLIDAASQRSHEALTNRTALIDATQKRIEPLIFEYFDILPTEQILIEDTINLIIPSFRPSPQSRTVPTIELSSAGVMEKYTTRLCETLNNWAKRSNAQVIGSIKRSSAMGTGLVILEKVPRGSSSSFSDDEDIFTALNQLRDITSMKVNTFELMRGVKVFAGNRLYILKPISHRYWTETAALNDADEIASSILMQPTEEPA